jgi:GT2 family glycosyltransferase
MTPAPARLSVVVVSHRRPGALRRCLLALSQCTGPPPEVIVVADKAGLEAVAGLPFGDRIATALRAEPNLSRARNDGAARAAGEVVAFLDDDAVPEPTWAQVIARAFGEDAKCAAATGPVLGPDGISCRVGPVSVDREGEEIALTDAASRFSPGMTLKLHGTNMAVRRDVFLSLGGFDPALRCHLGASDLALRLAAAGHRPVWLAGAQVHHAPADGGNRSEDLVPRDLHELGASWAVFLRKHAPSEIDAGLARLAETQRARLFRLARRRRLGPREIERLMASLRDGMTEGRGRPTGGSSLQRDAAAFRPIRDGAAGADIVLAGWRLWAGRLRAEARHLAEGGARVTLFLFEPTFRAHRVRYVDGGWWEQTGGLFGRSQPGAAWLRPWRLSSRIEGEISRLHSVRFEETPLVRFMDR